MALPAIRVNKVYSKGAAARCTRPPKAMCGDAEHDASQRQATLKKQQAKLQHGSQWEDGPLEVTFTSRPCFSKIQEQLLQGGRSPLHTSIEDNARR